MTMATRWLTPYTLPFFFSILTVAALSAGSRDVGLSHKTDTGSTGRDYQLTTSRQEEPPPLRIPGFCVACVMGLAEQNVTPMSKYYIGYEDGMSGEVLLLRISGGCIAHRGMVELRN